MTQLLWMRHTYYIVIALIITLSTSIALDIEEMELNEPQNNPNLSIIHDDLSVNNTSFASVSSNSQYSQLRPDTFIELNMDNKEYLQNLYDELKSMDVGKGNGILGCLRQFTNCCAGYHVACESFWSALNGPLGIASLLSSGGNAILTVVAAAAASGANPNEQLVLGLSIAATISGVMSSALSALKMYASTRSTTEQEKAAFDLLAQYQTHYMEVFRARGRAAARLAQYPDDQELQGLVRCFDELLNLAKDELDEFQSRAQIMKHKQDDVREVESREQAVLLNQVQNNAINQGHTSTNQPIFEQLPTEYSCFQKFLGWYNMTAFSVYQFVEGPAGLINTLCSAANSALVVFSIFNTGSVQQGLLYGGAAAAGIGTIASGVKFYAGARVDSILSRLRKIYGKHSDLYEAINRAQILANNPQLQPHPIQPQEGA